MSDMGFSINCMHKKRERGHILNLVQNASRTLAFTSGLLEDFEGRLRVRRGRFDVYSTQTTTKQHQDQYNNRRFKRSARETSYDDRRKGSGWNGSGRYSSRFQRIGNREAKG